MALDLTCATLPTTAMYARLQNIVARSSRMPEPTLAEFFFFFFFFFFQGDHTLSRKKLCDIVELDA